MSIDFTETASVTATGESLVYEMPDGSTFSPAEAAKQFEQVKKSLAQFDQLAKRMDQLAKSVDRLAKQVNGLAKHADAVQEKNGMNIARLAKRITECLDAKTAAVIHHAENATIYM